MFHQMKKTVLHSISHLLTGYSLKLLYLFKLYLAVYNQVTTLNISLLYQ